VSLVLLFHVNLNNQPYTKKANIVFYIKAMSQHTTLDALLPASMFVCLCFQLAPLGPYTGNYTSADMLKLIMELGYFLARLQRLR
jgi:hypothetical protein